MWKRYAILLCSLLRWLHEKLSNYNVFIPEEDNYEDDNTESAGPVITVKRQKYATRLYIPLLVGK